MIRPTKKLGQNFLTNPGIADKFIQSAKPEITDTFVEIGPGKGAITLKIAPQIHHLYCIEIDHSLVEFLHEQLTTKNIENVDILEKDVLSLRPEELPETPYKIIGALPYNISKRIIMQFLTIPQKRPSELVFILQKEVVENYTATAPHGTFLSNWAQVYCSEIKSLFTIKKENFWPKPKVDSAAILFKLKQPEEDHQHFSKFLKLAFSQPRKTLRNTLTLKQEIPILSKRPAELTLSQLKDLFMLYNQSRNESESKEN